MTQEKNRSCFVLLAGAGLRASIWSEMQPQLEGATYALEVESSGESRGSLVYLQEYVSQYAQLITKIPEGPLILVGHSIGGMLATQLLEHPDVKGRVQGIVAIASVLPLAGQSFAGNLPWPMRWMMPMLLRVVGTKPPVSLIEKDLCGGLSASQTQSVVENFQPEPRCLYTDACRAFQGPSHRLYVRLREDRSMSLKEQNRMQKRLEPCTSAELPTGHLPMLEQAKELAALLNTFARQVSPGPNKL